MPMFLIAFLLVAMAAIAVLTILTAAAGLIVLAALIALAVATLAPRIKAPHPIGSGKPRAQRPVGFGDWG